MSREQLIVNRTDDEGDKKVSEFFDRSYPTSEMVEFFKESQKKEYVTDADFATVFMKVASECAPKDWSELKDTVHTMFSGKLDDKFDTWETKMALDKTALREIFSR